MLPPYRFPQVPTSLTRREADVLHGLAAGKRVLEVGSLFGASTIVMADQATIVYAIDPHEGYPASNPRSTKEQFEKNLIAYGVRDRVVPLYRRVQDCKALPSVGLVFIDYTEECDEIIGHTLQLAKPSVIAVHDFGHELWTKATSAVLKWSSQRLWPIKITDSLAVMEIPCLT